MFEFNIFIPENEEHGRKQKTVSAPEFTAAEASNDKVVWCRIDRDDLSLGLDYAGTLGVV